MLEPTAKLLDPTSDEAAIFRRRFRVPYPFFVELVGVVRKEGWFPSPEFDVAGRRCIPLELKVCARFRVLKIAACVFLKNYLN